MRGGDTLPPQVGRRRRHRSHCLRPSRHSPGGAPETWPRTPRTAPGAGCGTGAAVPAQPEPGVSSGLLRAALARAPGTDAPIWSPCRAVSRERR